MLNVGASKIRIGFWGFLVITRVYYTPLNPILIIKASTLRFRAGAARLWVFDQA